MGNKNDGRSLARPDPLEVLEKWREYRFGLVPFDSADMLVSESEIISDLKTNPDAVIARGKEDSDCEYCLIVESCIIRKQGY